MALNPGKADATTGIAKAIYDAMDAALAPPLEEAKADMDKIRASWKALSFAIASGVVAGFIHDAPAVPPADPSFAQPVSSKASDDAFWTWFDGFTKAFQTWAPVTADGIALKNKLKPFVDPGKPPTEMKGFVR